MNPIDYRKNMMAKLIKWKAKMDDLARKVASRGFKERENVIRNTQDLNILATETAPRTEQLKNDRPNEWASLKSIDNPSVDIRGKYVLRPRLSWTGLYGKEPWPRERKQWEKV